MQCSHCPHLELGPGGGGGGGGGGGTGMFPVQTFLNCIFDFTNHNRSILDRNGVFLTLWTVWTREKKYRGHSDNFWWVYYITSLSSFFLGKTMCGGPLPIISEQTLRTLAVWRPWPPSPTRLLAGLLTVVVHLTRPVDLNEHDLWNPISRVTWAGRVKWANGFFFQEIWAVELNEYHGFFHEICNEFSMIVTTRRRRKILGFFRQFSIDLTMEIMHLEHQNFKISGLRPAPKSTGRVQWAGRVKWALRTFCKQPTGRVKWALRTFCKQPTGLR